MVGDFIIPIRDASFPTHNLGIILGPFSDSAWQVGVMAFGVSFFLASYST